MERAIRSTTEKNSLLTIIAKNQMFFLRLPKICMGSGFCKWIGWSEVLQPVITAVNYTRSHGLNDR